MGRLTTDSIPNTSGTYVLCLWCRKLSSASVGKLGDREFRRGYYYYIGSAFGPGGLRARIKHHLSVITRPHWHLDYTHDIMAVKTVCFCPSPEHLEHDLASQVSGLDNVTVPILGFGCSDCSCRSHFFYSPRHVDLSAIAQATPLFESVAIR